jgi:hypothetical protein
VRSILAIAQRLLVLVVVRGGSAEYIDSISGVERQATLSIDQESMLVLIAKLTSCTNPERLVKAYSKSTLSTSILKLVQDVSKIKLTIVRPLILKYSVENLC